MDYDRCFTPCCCLRATWESLSLKKIRPQNPFYLILKGLQLGLYLIKPWIMIDD